MRKYPKSWKPSPIAIKSGWKNDPKVLSKIVTAITDEHYVADENEMMEMIDTALEFMKTKYDIRE